MKNFQYDSNTPAKPEDIERQLIVAIKQKDVKKVKLFISKGVDVNVRDEYGLTPAIYSGIVDHKKIAKLLVKKGADFSITDDNGWAPWHYAFYCNIKSKAVNTLEQLFP